MRPTSQNAIVLHHLETHSHITPLEALGVYRIFRLGARIYDIKAHLKATNDPRKIVSVNEQDPSGKTYARYSLTPRRVQTKSKTTRSPFAGWRSGMALAPVVMQ